MKKTITFLMLISSLTFVAGCSNTIENKDQVGENTQIEKEQKLSENTQIEKEEKLTEKNQIEKVKEKTDEIKIILFHATQRCYSCNKMEELTKKTLTENFSKELDEGKVSFQEINGELPKNNFIVMKYKATGLSVFINDIENGEDNIQEEKNLWRYIGNDTQFKNYLTAILNNLLDNN